jgi:intracellular septation protein
VLYLSFAVILAAGKLVWKRDFLALVMKEIDLPPPIWTRLTWSWVAFFVAMAATNWYVAFHFSTETWVDFKVWGGIGLFVLFALVQGVFLARHVIEPQR